MARVLLGRVIQQTDDLENMKNDMSLTFGGTDICGHFSVKKAKWQCNGSATLVDVAIGFYLQPDIRYCDIVDL